MSLSDSIGQKHTSLATGLGVLIALLCVNALQANPPGAANAAPDAAQTQPAQTQPAGPPPKFRCDQKEHNFGTAWATEKVEHTWIIHNDGEGDLTIEAKPTCGCTVASYDKLIKPGEQGKITAVLTTSNYTGDTQKPVTVHTNDPTQTVVSLNLKGKVVQKVVSEPTLAAYFGQIAPGINLTKTFKLTNNTDEPMQLEVTQPGESCFKVDVMEIEPGKVAELTVTVEEPLKDGLNTTAFSIKTGLPGMANLTLPCNVSKPPVIEITPPVIRLPSIAPPDTFRQVVNYRNNGPTPVKVLSAVCDDDRITTKINENTPGVMYAITVEVPKDYAVNNNKNPSLIITTDRQESPVSTIPFVASRLPQLAATQPATVTPESLVGRPAPSAMPKTLDGRQIRIGAGGDQIMVINFWSSWCAPSQTQIPKLEQLYQTFRRRGVEFVNISVDQLRPVQELQQVVQSLKTTMPVALDPNLAIAKQYGVTQFPTMFLVGRSGAVEAVKRGIGRVPVETNDMIDILKLQIETLLEGKTREEFPSLPPIVGYSCHIEPISSSNNLLTFGGLYVESLRQEAGLFNPKVQASYNLYFRNNSARPIEIKSITAGDEQVRVASNYPKVVEPDAVKFVTCTFETPPKATSFSHDVVIESSDPNRPKFTVTIAGNTKPFVQVEPASSIDFGYRPNTFVVPRLVALTYNGSGKIEYEQPESDSPQFKAELEVRSPELALLTIKTLPPFSPGMAKTMIRVKTNQPEQSEVVVPVKLYMPNRIEVVPPTAAIGMGPNPEPLFVTLLNTGTKPIKILEIQPNRPEISAKYTLEPDKLSYRIDISMPDHFRPSYAGDRLTIITDDDEFREFIVPVVRGSQASGLGRSLRGQ